LQKLDQNQILALPTFRDEKGLTLIGRACCENSLRSAELLHEFYKIRLTRHLKQREHLRLNILPSNSLGQEAMKMIDLEVKKTI
jgi:hypothetical protein